MSLTKPHLDALLVDDDPIDVQLFSRAVKESDLDIRLQTLQSGQQAKDYLQAKGEFADRSAHPMPDLIVLDLKMPGVSGFDFLAWRKASAIFSSIPVVILSGLKDSTQASMAAELGAGKYLTKPSDPNQWKEIVQEIWDFGTQSPA
jgi:two-component system, response regulator